MAECSDPSDTPLWVRMAGLGTGEGPGNIILGEKEESSETVDRTAVFINLSPESIALIQTMLTDMEIKDVEDSSHSPFTNLEMVYENKEGGRTIYKAMTNDEDHRVVAIKQIDIKLEEVYSGPSSTASTLSVTDTKGINSFLECCQEAVLQHDVFSHPNVLAIKDRWMQTDISWRKLVLNEDIPGDTNKAVNSTGLLLFEIIKFMADVSKNKNVPFTDDVKEALDSVNGYSLFLVMDIYDTNLRGFIQSEAYDSFEHPLKAVWRIVAQTAKGLDHVHQKGYIHMDVKPENILLKIEGEIVTVVVADFGLAKERAMGGVSTGRTGTKPFNLYPDKLYSEKVDTWSLGLVIYYLIESLRTLNEVTTRELYKVAYMFGNKKVVQEGVQNSLDLIRNMTESPYNWNDWNNLNPIHWNFYDLITRCLDADTSARLELVRIYQQVVLESQSAIIPDVLDDY